MSDNQFVVSIAIQPGSLTTENLPKILSWFSEHGVVVNPRWVAKTGGEAIDRTLSIDEYFRLFIKGIFAKEDGKFSYPNYLWTTLGDIIIQLGKNSDLIRIDFHMGNLNPEELITKRKHTLDEIYARADRLVDFVCFIWEFFGKKSISANGYWPQMKLVYRKDSVTGNLIEEISDLKNITGFAWLSIVPDGVSFPDKYANHIPLLGEEPDFKFPWYRKEKIKNGTLLVQSRLPWICINGVAGERPWAEHEKRWRELESKIER